MQNYFILIRFPLPNVNAKPVHFEQVIPTHPNPRHNNRHLQNNYEG
jgi:hypothetical protein